MLKRILFVILIFAISTGLVTSCKNEKDTAGILTDKWSGTYVWQDEDTEEFKVLVIESIDEKNVSITCESVRDTESFEAAIKSQQGRYIAANLGSRSFKMVLSPKYKYVEIDDMWTGGDSEGRTEFWSGKYKRLEEGEEIPRFGNSNWNGEYFCEENGQSVSVYGIKERYVLFTYTVEDENGETVVNKLECLESDATRAVYTKDERLVMIDLIKANKEIEITDMYMDDMENKGISGVYKKVVSEE